MALGLGEAVVPGGDGEAGGHPFHVVLERPGQGLVEIVQVEQQSPLRGGEHPEVRQVRVPAQLAGQPRGRGAGQVGGHDLRRAPVEGERGHHHPAVPDRDQVRLPGGVLLLQQRDRVRPVDRRHPPACGRGGVWIRASAPLRATVGNAGMRDHLHCHVSSTPIGSAGNTQCGSFHSRGGVAGVAVRAVGAGVTGSSRSPISRRGSAAGAVPPPVAAR